MTVGGDATRNESPNSTRKSQFSSSVPFANAPRLYALSQKPTGPRWTIQGRTPAFAEGKRGQAPGPGAYTPRSGPTSPQYSMLPRRDTDISSGRNNPGPGAYSPTLKGSGGFSLQGRNFPKEDRRSNPGPGAYTPRDPRHVSKQFSLAGRHGASSGDQTPGPSAYNPEKPRTAFSFSLMARGRDPPNAAARNPGPGAYDIGSARVSGKGTPPAFSLRGRVDYRPESMQGPGPGAYDGEKPSRHLAFSMTARRDGADSKSSMTPGPGAYTPQRPKTSGAGFGVGDRFSSKHLSQNPGPGAYTPRIDFESTKQTPRAFSLSSRTKLAGDDKTRPGPGAYNPSLHFVKASAPSHSLKGRIEMKSGGHDTPGPAAYNANRPTTAPAFTLKSRMTEHKGFVTPSPVAYNIKDIKKSPAFSLRGKAEYNPKSLVTPGPGAYETAFTFFEKPNRY